MEHQIFFQISSTSLILFLVLDPLGNLPLFVSLLKNESDVSYRRITIRESLVALGVLLLFLFFGKAILQYLQASETSLGIAGGVILFLIAIKMVFGTPMLNQEHTERKPFIVPLAIPLFAGPSTLTMLILMHGSRAMELHLILLALLLAWGAATLILLLGRNLSKFLGSHALDALESLMGFLLTVVAVEMLLKGFHAFFASSL